MKVVRCSPTFVFYINNVDVTKYDFVGILVIIRLVWTKVMELL